MIAQNIDEFSKRFSDSLTDVLNSPKGQEAFKELVLHYCRTMGMSITTANVEKLHDAFPGLLAAILLTDKRSPFAKEYASHVWEELQSGFQA